MSATEFQWVDVAVGGVAKRNNPRRLSEFSPNGTPDIYTTWRRFGPEFPEYVRTNPSPTTGKPPSVAGYNGPSVAPYLPLDVDVEGDAEGALSAVRGVLSELEALGVPLEWVRISFSGSKGYHLELPEELFGGFGVLPARESAHRHKLLAERMFPNPVDWKLDPGVYDATRLWRVENSLHGKTGLYAVPLSLEEVRSLSASGIRDLARTPREVPRPEGEPEPVPALVELWRCTTEPKRKRAAGGSGPFTKGERNRALTSLGGTLRQRGLGEEAVFAALWALNLEACDPPLDESEVRRIAQSVARYEAEGRDDTAAVKLITRRLSDVEPEEPRWLWKDRIPQGKVTLLIGDPGDGKSYVSLALAAHLTKAEALPEAEPPAAPAAVLLAAYEDGLADTIRPRADLLGADLGKLHIIEGAQEQSGKVRSFRATDLPALERELESKPNVRLLIVDPVVSLIGGRVDAYRDNEVRDALQPLVDLAARRGIAVLGIMHLRKGQADRAIYRISGSGGFGALARSVLLAAKDPETGRRALAHVKSNLGPLTEPLEYRIDGSGLTWLGVAPELTADRLLGPQSTEPKSEREEAEAFLSAALYDGPRLAAEVLEEAREAGIAKRTLDRARKRLGVRATKRHEEGGGRGAGVWEWSF